MTTNLTSQTAPVTERELDQLIWGLERYGLYPRQLAALKELREVRRAKGEPVAYMIGGHYLMHAHDPKVDNYASAEPLYVTPPAPAVPDAVEIAIENLKQKLVDCNRYNYCSDAVKSVESACRAAMLNAEKLNQPVSETNNSGWIPVSERMPLTLSDYDVDGVDVIVTDGVLVGTCECRRGYLPHPWVEWSNYGDIDAKNITHWQPLPAAPREVK